MDGKTLLKHVECLTQINELRNVASFWLYSENILEMHGLMNAKKIITEHIFVTADSSAALTHT